MNRPTETQRQSATLCGEGNNEMLHFAVVKHVGWFEESSKLSVLMKNWKHELSRAHLLADTLGGSGGLF